MPDPLEQARELYAAVRLFQDRLVRQHAKLASAGIEPPVCVELTLPQWNMLRLIREHEPVTVKVLAEAAAVSAPSASAMVDRLVGMGLVRREQSQQDRREVQVQVTEVGTTAIESMERYMLGVIQEILEKLGPDTAQQWVDVYRKIRSVMEAELAAERAASPPAQD